MRGTSGESNIANLWKDHFSAIANSVGSSSLRTIPGNNDVGPLWFGGVRIQPMFALVLVIKGD